MATYGLQLPDFSWIVDADPPTTMDRLRAAAEAAEQSGFSSLWVMDHLLQLPPLGGPAASILEGYVTLGALAAVTKRVELGTLVTGVTYRNPAHLAKQIVTLDALSGGRVDLGHRRGVVRHRARRVRLDVPAGEGALRTVARGDRDLSWNVRQRDVQLRWRPTTQSPKHVWCRDRSDAFPS